MKLTTLILIVCLTHVCANGFGQITLNEDHTPLKKVLQSISQQSGYYFFYDESELKGKQVSIRVSNASLETTLRQCFKNLPFTYKVLDKNIVITAKESSAVLSPPIVKIPPAAIVDTMTITGKVVDQGGRPLSGATISISNKQTNHNFFSMAVTDGNGQFTLAGVKSGDLIKVSFIGYLSRELKPGSHLGTIILDLASSELDETRIVAYGKDSRRFSVGSVSTVTSADIEKQPVTNVLEALQGRVPGLNVTSTNGLPGAQLKLQVRGQNTLVGNPLMQLLPYDQPLFIIDGVPFAPQNGNINQLGSLGMDLYLTSIPSGISGFIGVNPNDIESISVLRDADATSIYGTQGSNGVILITTKKGKAGKTTVNVSVNTGFNTETRSVKLMNTPQYLQLQKDAFAADGITPSADPLDYSGYFPPLTIFDQTKYTDWQHVLFGKTSNNTDAHASISGGSDNTTFMFSGGYTRADYNFPGNFSQDRASLHSSVSHSSVGGRFNISFGSDFSYNRNNSGSAGSVQKLVLPPNAPDLLDPTGKLIWDYQGVNLAGYPGYQFYSYLKQPYLLQNYNLNEILHLSYRLAPGLNFSANLGYNRNTNKESQEFSSASQYPGTSSSANFGNSTFETVNIEPQLDYSHSVGKGELSVLVGGTYKKTVQDFQTLNGSNYSNDGLLGSIAGAANITVAASGNTYRYNAGFGRIKYIYNQKYIVSLTGRRDGSSNFGPGNQFGNFGSAGLGWIFSEEAGFKKTLPFISYAKLSGNYGTTGSDGIAPYQYQAFFQTPPYTPAFQGVQPVLPMNLYNPNYGWAVKKSLNIALDLGLFKNRLLLNATYYRSREGNQLVNYSQPSQTGFTSVLENLNALVQNTGVELSLSSTNVKTKNFSWTSNFNISANRNKLLAFPDLASSTYASYYTIGQPTSQVMGFRYKDVNPTTGVFEFYDSKGQATYSPDQRPVAAGGDLVPIAKLEPKFFGGLGNDFSYKNFSLTVFFQFSKQTAPNYYHGLYSFSNGVPGGGLNEPAAIIGKYWKNPGDIVPLERLTTFSYSQAGIAGGQYFSQSSGVYGDDTYLRLKTVSLSYTLPERYMKRSGLSEMKVYVRALNLLTFTNYKVGDPEQPGGFADTFPMQRTIVFGISFNY